MDERELLVIVNEEVRVSAALPGAADDASVQLHGELAKRVVNKAVAISEAAFESSVRRSVGSAARTLSAAAAQLDSGVRIETAELELAIDVEGNVGVATAGASSSIRVTFAFNG